MDRIVEPTPRVNNIVRFYNTQSSAKHSELRGQLVSNGPLVIDGYPAFDFMRDFIEEPQKRIRNFDPLFDDRPFWSVEERVKAGEEVLCEVKGLHCHGFAEGENDLLDPCCRFCR